MNIFSRSIIFVILLLSIPYSIQPSNAATCNQNENVTSSCDDLSLDGAGVLTINSEAVVSSASTGGYAVIISGASNTLNNNGTIQGNSGNGLQNNANFGALNNYGTIKSMGMGGQYGVTNTSLITAIYNNGLIQALNTGISNSGTITSIINDLSGSIGAGGSAINNSGIIGAITNTGSISSAFTSAITNSGTISVFTNTATILSPWGDDIYNTGTITTMNNLNGGGVLSYLGGLPTNYNIIIDSVTSYGKLSGASGVTGAINFGVYNGSIVTSKLYSGVLQDITTSNVSSARSGTHNGLIWNLVLQNGSSTIWDLIFTGGSTVDTQSSLHSLASKLRGVFSSQVVATNFANMNTYDCNLFDDRGLCISVGGQKTYVDNPSFNMTSAVVVAGYKVSPTLRIGGFLNQNINSNTGASIDISNKSPLMGLFAVWNKNENHLGYQLKIANAYQDKDVTTIREVIVTSEAGRGNTELNTQSYVGELSYAFLANEDKTLVRPYAAVRYTRIKQDGYTEQTSSTVTAPLTYSALSDSSTAALVGVKLNHKLTEKVNLTGSLGIEQDLNHDVDNLTATGVSGLISENFNDNIKRTRPVASIGAYYMPAKNQRIAGDVYYQQLPFQSTGSTVAYINYTIGF